MQQDDGMLDHDYVRLGMDRVFVRVDRTMSRESRLCGVRPLWEGP